MHANREIVLVSRPTGMANAENFAIVDAPMPTIHEGEVLLETQYLSVDPYMRGRMNDRPSYILPFQLNKPITGGIVGKVVESKVPSIKVGDYYSGFLNWADYNVAKQNEIQKIDPNLAPLSTFLGTLGMPGLTAYFGLLEIGKPQDGETVVISGAAGAVGLTVGQIAKIKGCRVVGIAGSDDKIKTLLDFGFDAAVNYKSPHFKEELKKACPNGVDIYFDNVGGNITDLVLQMINKFARIVICGQISMYNQEKIDTGQRNFSILLTRSALAQGFIIADYAKRFTEGQKFLSEWVKNGKLKSKETVTTGLENAPKAFIGLFKGENTGKQIVKVK